jgi:M6 family metalloprotease-like protein
VQIDYAIFPREPDAAYTMPRSALSYGNGRSTAEIGSKWVELITAAVDSAATDPSGPCFADFNSFLIIHAGVGHETGELNDIRSVYLDTTDMQDFLTAPLFAGDGSCRREIRDAWILPESLSQNGRAGMNGLFAKFFGHQLGLIGLSNFADGLPALGAWSLMDVGANVRGFVLQDSLLFTLGFVPPHPMAWSKARLGWIQPVVVERDTTIRLSATDRSSELPKAIRIPITDSEYFLLENRVQRANRGTPSGVSSPLDDDETIWIDAGTVEFSRDDRAGVWRAVEEYDAFVPGSGVLIWHVDDQVIADRIAEGAVNNNPVRQGIALEEADGYRDVGNPIFSRLDQIEGSPDDPFHANGHAVFETTTTPNSSSNTGMASGLRIEVLSPPGDIVDVEIRFERSLAGWPRKVANGRRLQAADLNGDGELELVWSDDIGVRVASRGSEALWTIPNTRLLAAGDADGDGAWDLFVQGESEVAAWRFGDSESLWSHQVGDSVHAAAFLGPIDGLTSRSALVLAIDEVILLNSQTGQEIRRESATATALAAADLDGDGASELVAVDATRVLLVEASGLRQIRELVTMAPGKIVAGDLDADGSAEIVHSGGGWISSISNGGHEFAVQLPSPAIGAPALGDVDGDGLLEVVLATETDFQIFDATGLTHGDFPTGPAEFLELGPIITDPILADLDGNATQELLAGTGKGVLGMDITGQPLPGLPMLTTTAVSATPVAADINGDGELELAAAGSGAVYVWSPRAVRAQYTGKTADWPQQGFDARALYAAPKREARPAPPTDRLMPAEMAYCYPNPAVATDDAHLRFFLARPARLILEVFDAVGNRVDRIERETGLLTPSENELRWSLRTYASGLYICRLRAKEAGGGETEIFVRLAVSN